MAPLFRLRPELLLGDNIPRPLHGMAPRIVLGRSWWDKTRKTSYQSTGYRCLACGIHKTKAKNKKWLEGHEVYRIDYRKGRMTYVETVPLCHFCHNFIHDGRLLWLLETKQIAQSKYRDIIQHGQAILRKYNLVKPSKSERILVVLKAILRGEVAKSKDWKLVVFGKAYSPRDYKNVK